MTGRTGPEIRLIHVDQDLVVVDKPSGVLSVAGRGKQPSLIDHLRRMTEFRPDESLRVVHRLDAEASGLIIFSRTLEAQRAMVAQFVQGQVEKVYLALVNGYVMSDGEVNLAIGPSKRGPRMRIVKVGGKKSVTRYVVVERLPGNTLLECRPVTGRTHQIRVHMSAIGHPLTVDPLYGGGESIMLSVYKPKFRPSTRREERPLMSRLTLHAARIAFDHPADARRVEFEAPLPKDFNAVLTQLRKLR